MRARCSFLNPAPQGSTRQYESFSSLALTCTFSGVVFDGGHFWRALRKKKKENIFEVRKKEESIVVETINIFKTTDRKRVLFCTYMYIRTYSPVGN